jgi:hypothetical protein
VPEAIESTAEDIGTELVTHDHPPTTLFRTEDPVEVLERASRVAQALKSVIDQQGLVSKIQGREHVRVEGWTTLGSMLGVVPVVTWTRRTEDGWEARVEARTLDGRIVGAAEAMCSSAERTWKTRDDYALRSMAQTRATSKALRGPLGFVVTLAGYEATPFEEMPAEGFQDAPASRASAKQLKFLRTLATRAGVQPHEMAALMRALGMDIPADVKDLRPFVDALTPRQASAMIDTLQEGPVKSGESDVPAPAADEFTHPPVDDDVFSPEVPS